MATETPPSVVKAIAGMRFLRCPGRVQIGGRPGTPPSTVHAILVRRRTNRQHRIDRVTGDYRPAARTSTPARGSTSTPTSFDKIPSGGVHRCVGRQPGKRNAPATTGPPRGCRMQTPNRHGLCYTVINDRPRLAHAEIDADDKATTAIGVLHDATAWFAERGATVERKGSSPPTLPAQGPTPHEIPAPSSTSSTSGDPPLTDAGPPARSNASTARSATATPTPASAGSRSTAEKPSQRAWDPRPPPTQCTRSRTPDQPPDQLPRTPPPGRPVQ